MSVPLLGFLAPMPPELRPLRRELGLRRGTGDMQDWYVGSTGDHAVVAGLVGVGTERAADVTARLLARHPVDHVVVIGVAGGVAHGLSIGDVVSPAVVEAADGTAHEAAALPAATPRGRILSTDEFVKDPDRLHALAARGVDAIDMETAGVAAVCDERAVPWSAFRGISDQVLDPSVDDAVLGLLRPDGSADLGRVARLVASDPRRVAVLARLARNLSRATNAAVAAALAAAGDPRRR